MKNRTLLSLTMALAALAAPSAHASTGLKARDNASDDFADSQTVSNKDLSKLRGGFINIDGILVDISYNAVLAINGTTVNTVNLNTNDLVNAVQGGTPLQNIPPAVVQNVDNNALIASQQQLDLTINGAAAQATTQATIQQLNFQNSLVH